jgi:hypothetical protein
VTGPGRHHDDARAPQHRRQPRHQRWRALVRARAAPELALSVVSPGKYVAAALADDEVLRVIV